MKCVKKLKKCKKCMGRDIFSVLGFVSSYNGLPMWGPKIVKWGPRQKRQKDGKTERRKEGKRGREIERQKERGIERKKKRGDYGGDRREEVTSALPFWPPRLASPEVFFVSAFGAPFSFPFVNFPPLPLPSFGFWEQ